MIETNALPAIAKLFGGIAPQAETSEESPISAQFAQLLVLSLGAAPAKAEAAPAPGAPAQAKPHADAGKPGGKAGGKALPELPPALAVAAETEADTAEAGLATDTPTQASIAAAPQLPFPAIELTDFSALQTNAPTARQLLAMPAALRLPLGTPDVHAKAPGPNGATALSSAARPRAQQPVKPDQVEANQAPNSIPSQPGNQASLQAVIPTGITVQFVRPAQAAPVAVASKLSVQELRSGAVNADRSEPAPGTADTATDAPPVSSAGQLAAALRQLLARPGAEAPATDRAAAQPDTGPAAPPATPTPDEAAKASATAAQPAAESAIAVAPAASAQRAEPATAPATRAEAPLDFVQLIDRLVEAREAVRAAQPSLPVEAAIAHAEFGQVSLRFEQDGGALNVSLASPDPEFSRAVQAAAPASQQGLAQDNAQDHGAAPQRGDGPAQNGGNATPAQSGSQQRGQQPAQPFAGQRDLLAHKPQADGDGRPARRNGIFA